MRHGDNPLSKSEDHAMTTMPVYADWSNPPIRMFLSLNPEDDIRMTKSQCPLRPLIMLQRH
jgi:hypothetical protein